MKIQRIKKSKFILIKIEETNNKVIYYYRKNIFYCALLGSDTYGSINTCFRRGHCREKQPQKYSGIKSAQLKPPIERFLRDEGCSGEREN